MVNCGVILAKWKNQRYSLPPAWKPLHKPQPLQVLSLRDALSGDFYHDEGEAWVYPLQSTGILVRPCREGNPEAIKRELNVEIKQTGIFLDLDCIQAHKNKEDPPSNWWALVEKALSAFSQFKGWFTYRTQRGLRCGLIHEPAELDIAQNAKLEFYLQVEQKLKEEGLSDQVEVDRACLDVSRGFALPHICKRGVKIEREFTNLQVSPVDSSLEVIRSISKLYTDRAALNSGKEAPRLEKNNKRGATSTQNKKLKTVVPPQEVIDSLDNTEQYNLARSAFRSISRVIHHEELRREILKLLDTHIMQGRRQEKEPSWIERQLENMGEVEPIQEIVISNDHVLEAKKLEEFPSLLPLRQYFEHGDEVDLAEAVLETFGQDPLPIWHGDGIRKYNPLNHTWELYGHHALRRIVFNASGAQTADNKTIKITNAKVEGTVKVLASKVGVDGESQFDNAPLGVVVGNKYFTYCFEQGLKIQTPKPLHYAVHHLKYDTPPSILAYWNSEGEEGTPPKSPPLCTHYFLRKRLTRPREEGETQGQLNQEIEAKITTLGEWIGLALLGACTAEATAMIVHGKGSNGKSVLTSLIIDLFGAGRTCHLAPQAMKEKFSRAQLFGAAINVVSEMPESELLASDTLKAVISGDRIEVERKGKDPFTFKPKAGHLFSANTLPSSRDRSHGLWRRLVPIEFCHIFTDEDKDRELLSKLRTEYHILVFWALEKARKYFLNGGYTHEDQIKKWRMLWRSEVDSVASFEQEYLLPTKTTKEGEAIKDIWREFTQWCIENGNLGSAKMSLKAFSRQIGALPEVQRGRHGKQKTTKINRTYNQEVKIEDPWMKK